MSLFWPLVPGFKSKFYYSQNFLLTVIPSPLDSVVQSPWSPEKKSLCIWDHFEKDKSSSAHKIIVRYILTLVWINIYVCLWKTKMPPDLHRDVKETQLIRFYSVTHSGSVHGTKMTQVDNMVTDTGIDTTWLWICD